MAAKGDVRAMVKRLKEMGVLDEVGIDEDLAAACISQAQMSPEEVRAGLESECEDVAPTRVRRRRRG